MRNEQNDHVFNHSYGLPAMFATFMPILHTDMLWVLEYLFGRFERDAMFGQIVLIFVLIPFVPRYIIVVTYL